MNLENKTNTKEKEQHYQKYLKEKDYHQDLKRGSKGEEYHNSKL